MNLFKRRILFSRTFFFIIIIAVILSGLSFPAYSAYNNYNARIYKELAEAAYSDADYPGAVEFYQKSLSYKNDLGIEQKLNDSSKQATQRAYYLKAVELISFATNKEQYLVAKELLLKVFPANYYYDSSQKRISFCDQKIAEIIAAEKAAADAAAQTAAVATKSNLPKASHKNTTASPRGLDWWLSSEANHRCEESWNGFCLNSLGDAEWLALAKQALTIASGGPPEDYQVILDHAKYISKIDYVTLRDLLMQMYGSLPTGLSGRTDWIMVSSIMDNGVNPVKTARPVRLAMGIFH